MDDMEGLTLDFRVDLLDYFWNFGLLRRLTTFILKDCDFGFVFNFI